MALGKKTGGRQKGTRNKARLATDRQRKKLQDEGLDPKEYIKSCLADPANYDEIKYKAASELMEFYYPKLARNTVTGVMGMKSVDNMNEEELAAVLGALT